MCMPIAATASTTSGSSPNEAKEFCPPLNIEDNIRYPVLGAALQRRGGTARHDAVAWGYARAADALGVDIIENCEVTGIRKRCRRAARRGAGDHAAAPSARARSASRRRATPAWSWPWPACACRWRAYPLQALVSEPIKPIFPCVVMSNTIHAYISQSDKGELVIGAGTDAYTSYTQRGALHINTHTLDAICELFPQFRRIAHAAQLGRHRRCHARPLAHHRQDPGTRACTSIAAGAPAASRRPRARRMCLPGPSRATSRIRSTRRSRIERFRDGYLIDEAAAAAVAH